MSPATQPIQVTEFVDSIRKQVRSGKTFPVGHTTGIAYAKVFGPRNATTPEGHPITISSGPFDNTLQSAVEAIALAARKRFGIEVHLPHWYLEMAEDVSIPAGHPYEGKVPYTRLYHFKYLPEQQTKWKDRGLADASVPNLFRSSWYLSKRHAQPGYVVDQSLGTVLIPAVPATWNKSS